MNNPIATKETVMAMNTLFDAVNACIQQDLLMKKKLYNCIVQFKKESTDTQCFIDKMYSLFCVYDFINKNVNRDMIYVITEQLQKFCGFTEKHELIQMLNSNYVKKDMLELLEKCTIEELNKG